MTRVQACIEAVSSQKKVILRFIRSCLMSLMVVSKLLVICYSVLLDTIVCSHGALHTLTQNANTLPNPNPRRFKCTIRETASSVIGGKWMLHECIRMGRCLLSVHGLCSFHFSHYNLHLFDHKVLIQVLLEFMHLISGASHSSGVESTLIESIIVTMACLDAFIAKKSPFFVKMAQVELEIILTSVSRYFSFISSSTNQPLANIRCFVKVSCPNDLIDSALTLKKNEVSLSNVQEREATVEVLRPSVKKPDCSVVKLVQQMP